MRRLTKQVTMSILNRGMDSSLSAKCSSLSSFYEGQVGGAPVFSVTLTGVSCSLHSTPFRRGSRIISTGAISHPFTPQNDDSSRSVPLSKLRQHQESLARQQEYMAKRNKTMKYDTDSPNYEAKKRALRLKQRIDYKSVHGSFLLKELHPSNWKNSNGIPRANPKESNNSSLVVEHAVAVERVAETVNASSVQDSIELGTENRIYASEPPRDVFVVDSISTAEVAMKQLMSLSSKDRIFACDTEVMGIDVAKQSPVCHGRVICFSIYAGPDVHFGVSSQEKGIRKPMLWVDTHLGGSDDKAEEAAQILDIFRPFFESNCHLKVWHNYSFDRHVLERMGIKISGFGGDTMHMARLWDSSRTTKGGYSLEVLTAEAELMGDDVAENGGKISMKKIFGRRNVKKDGTEGKLIVLPPVEELQTSHDTRWKWVYYSAFDAKSTWDLYNCLQKKLSTEHIEPDPAVAHAYSCNGIVLTTLWDIYRLIWRPFGELLTNMESKGMAVDRSHLAEAEKVAIMDQQDANSIFRKWASSLVPDAEYMNVNSGPQVLQLLFGGVPNRSSGKPGVPLERTFKVPNPNTLEIDGKKPKKTIDITLHSVWGPNKASPLKPDVYTPSGMPACSTPVLKSLAGKPGRAKKALADLGSEMHGDAIGLENVRDDFDIEGVPWPVDDTEIQKLQLQRQELLRKRTQAELTEIASTNGYGKLFSHFNGNVKDGLAACAAVDSLIDASAIDTLLSNFIVPLQSEDVSCPDVRGVHRVHCSLNINTETGRLSARRPNLQNQPALEKDRYKVRRAFSADREAGKSLIVADYGQLELRILAHMANCKSMINAFKLGGDFHSRTAMGMYDHIKKAVDSGKCLLEWDGDGENPPAPLLKDVFAAERRKAKVLNFSIAYGKTAHGLSKDWGVTLNEAEETVRRWYADRIEVKEWQERQHQAAIEHGYVCTIIGRRRQLPDARSSNKAARAHALRAAINTPIQGSAADIATAAMLRINTDERLSGMGWQLLLQVHDEVILEGPKESAEEAREVVIECMRNPFNTNVEDPLRIELAVDSKYADTWYDAK